MMRFSYGLCAAYPPEVRADEETAVPPSSGWWTEGLLRSFRDAVSPSASAATTATTYTATQFDLCSLGMDVLESLTDMRLLS